MLHGEVTFASFVATAPENMIHKNVFGSLSELLFLDSLGNEGASCATRVSILQLMRSAKAGLALSSNSKRCRIGMAVRPESPFGIA